MVELSVLNDSISFFFFFNMIQTCKNMLLQQMRPINEDTMQFKILLTYNKPLK